MSYIYHYICSCPLRIRVILACCYGATQYLCISKLLTIIRNIIYAHMCQCVYVHCDSVVNKHIVVNCLEVCRWVKYWAISFMYIPCCVNGVVCVIIPLHELYCMILIHVWPMRYVCLLYNYVEHVLQLLNRLHTITDNNLISTRFHVCNVLFN
jgi:hypothetical protein